MNISSVNASSIGFYAKNLNNFTLSFDLSITDSVSNSTKVLNTTDLPLCPDDPPNLGKIYSLGIN